MSFNRLMMVFALTTTYVNTSRILCIFPTPSISHQSVFQPVWKTLSLRGHQVTVITPNPLRDPKLTNLTEIDVSGVYEFQERNDVDVKIAKSLTMEELTYVVFITTLPQYDKMLQQKEVKDIIRRASNSFDLLMIEYLQPLFFAFALKFNCPVVGISSLSDLPHYYVFGRAPLNPLAYPYISGPPGDLSTIWQRIEHLRCFLVYIFYVEYLAMPKHQEIAKKHFGNDVGSLSGAMYNVSLVFITRNVFINGARPMPPNIVEIGRINIQKTSKLPEVRGVMLVNTRKKNQSITAIYN